MIQYSCGNQIFGLLNSIAKFSRKFFSTTRVKRSFRGKGVDWKTRDIRLEVPHVWLAVAAFV